MNVKRFAALGLFLLACGGEDKAPRPEENYCRPILPVSDSPDPGSGPVDCHALDGYELYRLDDFEPGSAIQGWYTNTDRTAAQDPAPDDSPPHTTPIPNGRCVGVAPSASAPTQCTSPSDLPGSCNESVPMASRTGMHIVSGLLTNNGGLLGLNFSLTDCCDPANPGDMSDPHNPCFCDPFHPDKLCGEQDLVCPYRPGPPEVGPCSIGLRPSPARRGCNGFDASKWDGIVLWARVAPGSANSIRIRAADRVTSDTTCICNPYTNQNDSSSACDKAGKYVDVDSTFRPFFVPFAEMQQAGYGLRDPFLDLSRLFSMGIEYRFGRWDLWIDDVWFYRRRP